MPLSRRAVKAFSVALLILSMTVGCDDIAKQLGYAPAKATEPKQPTVTTSVTQAESKSQPRFLFPAQSGAFPAASVALDSQTGKLCKTYGWADSSKHASGLPLCSELTSPASVSAKQNNGKLVSLKKAMAIPQNKGKSEADVRKDIESHGYTVIP